MLFTKIPVLKSGNRSRLIKLALIPTFRCILPATKLRFVSVLERSEKVVVETLALKEQPILILTAGKKLC